MAADDNEHSSIASTSNGSSSPVTNSPSSSAVVGPKKRGILDVDALWRKKKILELKNKQIEEKNQQDNENERPKESEEKAAAGQAMRQPIPTRSNAAEKRKSARIAHQREMEGRIQDESMDGKTIKHTVLRSRTVYPKLPDSPGSENGDLGDTYSPSVSAGPQYVSEFTTIDYHQHGPNTVAPGTYTVYAPDTSNYAAYYQYSGNVQQSPTQSYMLHNHGGQSPNSGDDDNGGALGHTARASPATVTWLLDNYETADGTSLPRCTLYDHYKRHCQENRLDPVNAASFGKLIRSVFLGLRTRRLGTRGNSKYHYYGIRIKADSSLNRQGVVVSPTEPDPYADSVNTVVANSRQYSTHATKRHGPPSISSSSNSASPTYSSPVTQDVMPRYRNNGTTSEDRASLGDGEIPAVDFHSIEGFEETLVKLGMDMSHVEKFVSCYQQNCHNVLHFVKQLQFEEIEECWFSFWQAEYDELDDEDFMPERLSQQQLYALCSLAPTQDYIIEMDLAFYQTVVDVLVPSVLMSKMTPVLTQHCRNFAKNADMYLRKAMQGAPENLLRKKLQTVKYLAQGLKRYTSLNHLAQAARAVLQKQDQVSAMYNDYTRVDMTQVHEQAGWVCGCDQLMVQHINNAFRSNLQKMVPMEQWAEWLESIVDQTLAKYHDKPVEVITDVGKQFLLNWSFYTSMVIRDLTLRSAASFGSFHLIRLLADDYMFYLIESRIAKAGNQPLITVIRQEKDYPLFDDIRIPHPVIHHDEFIVTAPPVFDHKFQPTVHHDTDGFEVKRMRYHENRENVQVEVVEEVDGQNILCI